MSEPSRPSSPNVPAIDLGSELRHYRLMSEAAIRAFEPMRQAMLTAPGIASADLAATCLRSAADVARFQSTMSQLDRIALSLGAAGIDKALADSAAKAMAMVHPDLDRAARLSAQLARSMTIPPSLLQSLEAARQAERHIMTSIDKVASLAEVMKSTMSGFSGSTLLRPEYLSAAWWAPATDALAGLGKAYSAIEGHLSASTVDTARTAGFLSPLPTYEYYCGIDLAALLSAKPQSAVAPETRHVIRARLRAEATDPVDAALAELGGKLGSMWIGAKQARMSNNPDRVRHFAVSLRELLRTLLHILAPDDAVRAWSSSQTDLTPDGRPTRRARLKFICRSSEAAPLQDFIQKDIETVLAYEQLLERGTHAPTGDLPPDAAAAMEARMESTIRFLVAVHKASSRS